MNSCREYYFLKLRQQQHHTGIVVKCHNTSGSHLISEFVTLKSENLHFLFNPLCLLCSIFPEHPWRMAGRFLHRRCHQRAGSIGLHPVWWRKSAALGHPHILQPWRMRLSASEREIRNQQWCLLPVTEREHNQFNAGSLVGVTPPITQVSQVFSYRWKISAAQVQAAAPILVNICF